MIKVHLSPSSLSSVKLRDMVDLALIIDVATITGLLMGIVLVEWLNKLLGN